MGRSTPPTPLDRDYLDLALEAFELRLTQQIHTMVRRLTIIFGVALTVYLLIVIAFEQLILASSQQILTRLP